MAHQTRRDKARRLEELCRARRIPLTHQRRAILDAVAKCSGHPTADELYEYVRRQLPNVSRTTVYRVLELLTDLGLVTKIGHPSGTIRFDPKTEPHHHLFCIRCNKLIDFEDPDLDAIKAPNTRRVGFKVTDYSVHFRGVCQACQRRQASRRKGGSRKTARKRRGGAAAKHV